MSCTLSEFEQFFQNCSYYQRLSDILSAGICIADVQGTIRFMNTSFAKEFNIDITTVVGRNICDFFPNSALLPVMFRGESEEQVAFEYKGINAFISRYPIFENGHVVGGLIEVHSRDVEALKKHLQYIDALRKKVSFYKRKTQHLLRAVHSLDAMLGDSPPMQLLRQKVKAFARGKAPVFITGESGVGKELVAHAIHEVSKRSDGSFVRVNCAAIPRELIESELFGYEGGAFTGAKSSGRLGKFDLAEGGTIFLDEIGEIPLTIQTKLLRVLESGEIQRVGSDHVYLSDFRIVAATNRNLLEMVAQGSFREDLYHRLNILKIEVPPLRERIVDLPMLVTHFLYNIAEQLGQGQDLTVSNGALQMLCNYHWPGNVRELKNVLTFAAYSLENDCSMLDVCHFPPLLQNIKVVSMQSDTNLRTLQHSITRDAIMTTLAHCRNNKSKAAESLGISRTALYKHLKKYNDIP